MLDTRAARQLLAELEMISHGSTAAWDTSGGHSSEKPLLPQGEANPPHLWLRTELEKANTQRQVDMVAEKARTALRKARYAPDRRHRRDTVEWRRAIAHDPRIAKDVAVIFDVSIRTVYYYRKEFRTAA